MRLNDSEWTIMRVVWEDAPVSPRDVLDRVGYRTGWAYTTVKTLLERLAEKGVVSRKKQGNTFFYSPRLTRDRARRSALRALVDRAFDGTIGGLVHHLVAEEKLSATDRKRITEALARLEREEKKR